MQMTESYILLEGIRLHARHGVMAQERLTGNDYTVSLRIGYDVSKAVETDRVEATLNYAEAYRVVKEEMAVPSDLVEHVAGRIAKRLFSDFPGVTSLAIRLLKDNPPMGASIEGAGVELHYIL